MKKFMQENISFTITVVDGKKNPSGVMKTKSISVAPDGVVTFLLEAKENERS